MKFTSLGSILCTAIAGIIVGGSGDRANAATFTLYDGATFSGTPDNAPGTYLTFNSFDPLALAIPGTQTASGGKTTLNTSSPESLYGGYSNYNLSNILTNPAFPVLDSNAGYTIGFTIKINSQTNTGTNGANRAGFSIIALDNTKKGIEIGFRNSDIFAQNSNFSAISPAEQKTAFGSVLSTLSTYNLKILGNSYTLSNGSTDLFTGLLRSYIISPSNPLTAVYGNSNFLFFGDDTTSAGASVDIQNITLITNTAAVPEPSSLIGTAIAIGSSALLKRKLCKSSNKNLEL